jgi:hypothetical protein
MPVSCLTQFPIRETRVACIQNGVVVIPPLKRRPRDLYGRLVRGLREQRELRCSPPEIAASKEIQCSNGLLCCARGKKFTPTRKSQGLRYLPSSVDPPRCAWRVLGRTIAEACISKPWEKIGASPAVPGPLKWTRLLFLEPGRLVFEFLYFLGLGENRRCQKEEKRG